MCPGAAGFLPTQGCWAGAAPAHTWDQGTGGLCLTPSPLHHAAKFGSFGSSVLAVPGSDHSQPGLQRRDGVGPLPCNKAFPWECHGFQVSEHKKPGAATAP